MNIYSFSRLGVNKNYFIELRTNTVSIGTTCQDFGQNDGSSQLLLVLVVIDLV